MKKSKYTEEQIIGFLRHAEAGVPVKDLCRKRRVQRRYVLQVASAFRRHGGRRREAAA